MKRTIANQIAKLWNDNFAGSYAPTKTKAMVRKDYRKGECSVEVHPYGEENDGHSFHSHNEVSDIERAFKVSAFIMQDENHRIYARFY